ncbi:MerR family transcriptional regulator [Gorillibacterium sp. sgz5001074]|uniref:MerR family transcriptional regulator n=1 Tax=Gorillibacterium sp. sgz5001074 TaxID=3446695 RepID=UPI003F66195A
MTLYRVGELAKLTDTSPRTIDYYTQLGLIHPVKRMDNHYRYYNDETISRLKRIETMKKEKYSLEEIKANLDRLDRVSSQEDVADKLTSLQLHMQQLEKEVKELEPLIDQLKPNQAKQLFKLLTPHGAACIEAIMILLGKGPLL